jgi:hypothetical protein
MRMLIISSVVLIFVVVIVIAVNMPDEELGIGPKELTYDRASPERPTEGNAYFAMLGFEASTGEDIYAVGQQAHSAYADLVVTGPIDLSHLVEDILGPPIGFVRTFHPQCENDKSNCLSLYKQSQDVYSRLFVENELILARYARLKEYSHFEDLMSFRPWHTSIKFHPAIYSAHVLKVAEAANLFNKADHRRGLELIVADIRLWRKIFAGTGDHDGKIYSQLALNQNYTLLDEMSTIMIAGGDNLEGIDEAITPLTATEKSLDLAFDKDFRTLYWTLSHGLWPLDMTRMSLLERYFFKTNSTLNRAFEIFHSMKKVVRAKPVQFETEWSLLNGMLKAAERKRLGLIYNPLGKLFIAASFDSEGGRNWNISLHALDSKISRIRKKVYER